jgi:sugar phosphate isomerase/epimerase
MNRFKLGLVLETVGLPPRVALGEAAKLGVNGVQVGGVGDLAPDRLTATGRREFRTLLRGYNLELAAVHCPLRRGLDAAEEQGKRVEHVRKVLQLAADLGAPAVGLPFPAVPTDPESPRATLLREVLTDLTRFADRVGVRLAVEPGLDPGDKVRDYLATYDTGGLGVTFDPANFLLNRHDPLASLAALGRFVVHTHARDGRTVRVSGSGGEVPVGAGDIEWMVYIATLESVGYTGFLTVDREEGTAKFADAAAGVRFLRRFVPATTS